LPPLLQLISHINHSFGRFYASMNCVGEVCLYTGEGENDVWFFNFTITSYRSLCNIFVLFIQDDFRNYGIKIRVKYRSSEPLLDLSGTHHSGGERAVATALYMLAMQELTQVPFRCVDEINQVHILTTAVIAHRWYVTITNFISKGYGSDQWASCFWFTCRNGMQGNKRPVFPSYSKSNLIILLTVNYFIHSIIFFFVYLVASWSWLQSQHEDSFCTKWRVCVRWMEHWQALANNSSHEHPKLIFFFCFTIFFTLTAISNSSFDSEIYMFIHKPMRHYNNGSCFIWNLPRIPRS
jgi:hypothetical protein